MRILHVIMALDFGGVESYVLRLSRAMVELGHEVTVLSGGGPMEQPLRDAGIEVIVAPIKKDPLSACEALAGRSFDVINGQNYNSARVADIVSRKIGVPHVMTVHGPRDFLRRVLYRHWSDAIITVSGADKRGISGFLGVRPERVFVSFPPVDAERYHIDPNAKSIAGEFFPEPECKLILHVSRFSNRKAQVAYECMKAMPRILESEPNARLLIVGAGPLFDAVKSRADSVAARLGPVVRVEGPRFDVAALYRSASVVVATAVTAMEALACGALVVAAGRTGYLGPVEPAMLSQCLDLLFADHGVCPRPAKAEVLEQDILRMMADQAHWRGLSAQVAGLLASDFTPIDAARDVLAVYEQALKTEPSQVACDEDVIRGSRRE